MKIEKSKEEIVLSACIKINKSQTINEIKEKANNGIELTNKEAYILIDQIYENIKEFKEELFIKYILSKKTKQEIEKFYSYVIKAFGPVLDDITKKTDGPKVKNITILMQQEKYFYEYYSLMMEDKENEEIKNVQYRLRRNLENIKDNED